MKVAKKLFCLFLIQVFLINTSFKYFQPLYADDISIKTLYFHKDYLGCIRSITDENGNVIENYSYDAFGNIINRNRTINNVYKYIAREYDSESNLYYFRARYYNPVIGRFLSKDPLTWSLNDRRIIKDRNESLNKIMESFKTNSFLILKARYLNEKLSIFNDNTLKNIIMRLNGIESTYSCNYYIYCNNDPVN